MVVASSKDGKKPGQSSAKAKATPTTEQVETRTLNFSLEPDLISHLLQDGRASMSDLSEVSGYHRQTAWRNVKALEEDVIWGYTAVVDENKLGWTNYMVLAKINELSKDDLPTLREFKARLDQGHNMFLKSIHATDDDLHHWIVEVSVRSPLTLNNAIVRLMAEFPSLVTEKPIVIQQVCTLRQSGKDNPDTEQLKALLADLIS